MSVRLSNFGPIKMCNLPCFADSNLINKSLPWNYDFKFVVEEISNVNDKAQVSTKYKQ